jgi:DNA adenine methylase
MTKTILKWAGNKSKVMEKISTHFPVHYSRYLEPFAGSLGSFLHSNVTRPALLNDLNKEIINLFESKVANIANAYIKSKEEYYRIRNLDKEDNWLLQDRFVRAARTVYVNKMCFNGLYRINKSGYNNVPYGSGRKGEVLPIKEAKNFSDAIKNCVFSTLDYKTFLNDSKPNDLIYLDPPYVDLKDPEKEFGGYVGGFGWSEQKELVNKCKELKSKGCFVVVSNSYCDATLSLYEDFQINIIEAPRYISRKSENRKPVKEIVAVL